MSGGDKERAKEKHWFLSMLHTEKRDYDGLRQLPTRKSPKIVHQFFCQFKNYWVKISFLQKFVSQI
jgi:hypothetical protein